MSGYRPVFSMPAKIPQATESTDPVPERLGAAQPGPGADSLVRGDPDRGGSSGSPVTVTGGPVSQYAMIAQHRAEVTQRRGAIGTNPLPERWRSDVEHVREGEVL